MNTKPIKVILFGASGMVGKGVLLEALDSDAIESVLSIGRSSCGVTHPKLKEIAHKDMMDFSPIKNELKGYDACFYCLGISSAGMNEADYTHITYDFTVSTAKALLEQNPEMTICFVSGSGTDSSEKGRTMWARVKGKAENALLNMPFKAAYMFRPGYIQPKKGIRSKVWWYQLVYDMFGFLYPVWKTLFPKFVTTTIKVGDAMINAATKGYPKQILETTDINQLANAN